jgi:hypothetical protein
MRGPIARISRSGARSGVARRIDRRRRKYQAVRVFLASRARDSQSLEYFTVAPTLLLQKPDDRRLEPLDGSATLGALLDEMRRRINT